MKGRVAYIDNLRMLTVTLLIVYHAAMAYNTWGEQNYIFFRESKPLAAVVSFISPWFMPLMFLLAGASARFSIRKRGCGQFLKERALRLGIPLVFGLLVITPVLSYIADLTHNGYSGGFFEHYGIFFTRFTDLSGYDGGFTLGHLWFIAVLAVISVISCGAIKGAEALGISGGKPKAVCGVLLSAGAVAALDVKTLGKPLITYLCVYLLGYVFFSKRESVDRLAGYKWVYTAVFLAASAANTVLFIFVGKYSGLNTACNYIAFVFSIPALVSLGHDHLDVSTRFTRYGSGISYMFYILHFPIVVVCQYLLARAGAGSIANFFLTVPAAYLLTFGLCSLIQRARYLKALFGSKPGRTQQMPSAQTS